MKIERVRRERIPRNWGMIAETLAPAIKTGRRTEAQVLGELMAGVCTLWVVTGDAAGLIVTSKGWVNETNRKGLWILLAAGAVRGGPRKRLDAYRGLIGQVEAVARADGMDELWLEARHAWGRALDGFEVVRRLHDHTEWRKVLTNGPI